MQVLSSAATEISKLQESLVEADTTIMQNMYDLDTMRFLLHMLKFHQVFWCSYGRCSCDIRYAMSSLIWRAD